MDIMDIYCEKESGNSVLSALDNDDDHQFHKLSEDRFLHETDSSNFT